MKNKQAKQKTIEHIIINWAFHSVFLLIQCQENLIAGIYKWKQKSQILTPVQEAAAYQKAVLWMAKSL